MSSIYYQSRQDFSTRLAAIEGMSLQRHMAWKYTYHRAMYNDNQAQFERHLHGAMGYKASTVDDWG